MQYMRHTQDTIGDLSKLIDDQHEGMGLLGEVLATLKINLVRGAFDTIPHLEQWKTIIERFEQRHTRVLEKIKTNPVVNRYADTPKCSMCNGDGYSRKPRLGDEPCGECNGTGKAAAVQTESGIDK